MAGRAVIAEVTRAPFGVRGETARAVCELLGIDPNTTTQIVLTPGFAEVTTLVRADDDTDDTPGGEA